MAILLIYYNLHIISTTVKISIHLARPTGLLSYTQRPKEQGDLDCLPAHLTVGRGPAECHGESRY